MRYIQKTNSPKSFVIAMLDKILVSIDNKFSEMNELSIKEGNQNWEKSKLAQILLTMKKIIMKAKELYLHKPTDKDQKKIWRAKIKSLKLQLKMEIKIASNEIQIQKEKVKKQTLLKSRQKQKVLTQIELMILKQQQNTR